MRHLCVPNLSQWQHYKDRNPPWIKLHSDLLRDYNFSFLPDKTKAHLMLIWLLASQIDNIVPDDADYIQRMTGMKEKPDLKLLIQKGFLSYVAGCKQDASDMLAECEQGAMAETEAETEVEKETTRKRVTLDGLSVDHIAEWLAQKRGQGKYLDHDEHFILEYFRNYCKSKGKTYADYIAGYRNAFEWDRCQPKNQPRASGKIEIRHGDRKSQAQLAYEAIQRAAATREQGSPR